MRKLNDNHGYPKVSWALRYASIRLRATPETVALGEEIDEERARLETAHDAFEQAREERVATTALIGHLDGGVDGHVAGIAREVAVITENNKEDPFYKTLFPVAPSTATTPVASDSQNRFVKTLIDRIETDDRYESLRPRAAELKASQAELEQMLETRENLRTPELRASVDLQTALDSARRAYNKLYPRLSLLFDNKSFVETFFVKSSRSSATAPEEAPEVETE
jgi:hypothetical protein